MHIETLTLDRAFDVQRRRQSRYKALQHRRWTGERAWGARAVLVAGNAFVAMTA
ncbi:MAG TPA: hypothetical protein PKD73_17845 [Burkholderiaceae bacterium]|nr:hypothetical protein [Burkholderiaceae bacterium]